MKTILLKGQMRKDTGSKYAREMRKIGIVPCVMYGGKENVHFGVYEADFKNLVYTPNVYKVKLDLDGQIFQAILHDMQFHPVNDAIIHADFFETADDKPVVMHIPVKVAGNSPGVRAGGKLVKKITKLAIRGLVKDMPDFVEVSIDTLEIGQSIRVNAVSLKNLELLDAPENAILTCKTTRAVVAAEPDAKK